MRGPSRLLVPVTIEPHSQHALGEALDLAREGAAS